MNLKIYYLILVLINCINFKHIHEVILDYRLTHLLTCLKQESETQVNLAELDLETFTHYFEESVAIW